MAWGTGLGVLGLCLGSLGLREVQSLTRPIKSRRERHLPEQDARATGLRTPSLAKTERYRGRRLAASGPMGARRPAAQWGGADQPFLQFASPRELGGVLGGAGYHLVCHYLEDHYFGGGCRL